MSHNRPDKQSSHFTSISRGTVSFLGLCFSMSQSSSAKATDNEAKSNDDNRLPSSAPSDLVGNNDSSSYESPQSNQPTAQPIKQVTNNEPVAQPIKQPGAQDAQPVASPIQRPGAQEAQPIAQAIDRQQSNPAQSASFPFGALPTLAQQTIAALLHKESSPPPIHIPSTSHQMPALQFPVVLVHGFMGYSSLLINPITDKPVLEYFGQVRQMYEDAGYTVIVPVLPRSDKIENRAKALQVALGLIETQASTVSSSADQVTQKVTPIERADREEIEQIKTEASKLPNSQPVSSNVGTTLDSPTSKQSIHVLSNRRIDLGSYRGPFHLVVHSMGGLDSRHLITHLQPDDESQNRILTLTSVATPHRGSPLADIIVQQVQSNYVVPPFPLGTKDPITEGVKVDQLVGVMEKILHTSFSGMLDLTTTATADFNKSTPDRSGTHYFSYAGYRNFDPFSIFYMPSKLIQPREGPNDGLVSVESAKWGQYMGCVNLDHAQQVGNLDLGIPFSGHLALYREIAWTLSKVEQKHGAAQEALTKNRERKGSMTQDESQHLKQKERRASDRREHQRDDIAQHNQHTNRETRN